MIDGKIFFYQPIKNYIKTEDNIWKITVGQGDGYSTGCWLDYNYFQNYYKIIAIYLSKQQANTNPNPKATQQINFTGNLNGNNNRLMFFITEEAKETTLNFSQGTVKVL